MRDIISEQKRQTVLELLDRGLVMVHLDPRVEGTDVPPQFREDPVLRLNLAYGFNLPALDPGEEGLYAVLSFNRSDYGCFMPWEAIFAVTLPDDSHEGMVWPGFIPPEMDPFFAATGIGRRSPATSIRIQPPGAGDETAPTADRGAGDKRPNPFSVIEGGGAEPDGGDAPAEAEAEPDEGSEDGEDRPPRKRPNLKIVKG